jgi:hypothetical protein
MIDKRTAPFMAVVRRAATHSDPLRVEVAVALTLDQWRARKAEHGESEPGDLPL